MIFRLLLWCVAMTLWIASRTSRRLRAQLSRDMTVTIATRSGIARTYQFRNRRVSSRAGLSASADCLLTFPTAATGTRIFLASNAVEQIVAGMAAGDIVLRGLPAHVLWFYEMVMARAPWRSPQYLTMPDPYVTPDPHGKVADRITREPAQHAVDPRLTDAIAQREKLNIWRVGRRAPIPGRIDNFKHVVEVPTAAVQESA
jgi:hypothetical protein